jgi:hypothetical protein
VLPHAVVGFIDFLGFRGMVEEDAGIEEPRYLPLILDALALVEARVVGTGLELSQFSDSVVISSAFTPSGVNALVTTVRDLQRLLAERGISVRGGVDFGRHYAQDGRLFSMALVKAYELESRRAQVPRVLMSDNLLDWCLNHQDCDSAVAASITSQLLRDRDGEIFVHYLDTGLLSAHAKLVRATLALGQNNSARVLTKAHWLVDYHEYVADGAGEGALDPDDAARFQPLG